MERLDTKKKEKLQHSICVEVADFLKRKRMGKNYSITSVAEYLGISKSTVDRYESGVNIPLDMLPLFSFCYDFPMYEYFEKTHCTDMVESFKKATDVFILKRYKHKEVPTNITVRKVISKTYEENGIIYTQDVSSSERRDTFAERCRKGEENVPVEPFTEEEFGSYVSTVYTDKSEAIISAGKMLACISEATDQESLKTSLAKFIIDELIIKELSKNRNDASAQRAYAYYQKMLETADF